MNECLTRDESGQPRGKHVWAPGKFNGNPIRTCRFCGAREDGVPWFTTSRPRVISQTNSFFATCPAIIYRKSVVPGIEHYITFGCGGYGEVALHHPAARKPNGEITLVEKDTAICQKCRGAGIHWQKSSFSQSSVS